MPLGAADDHKAIWITLESTLQHSLTNRSNNLICKFVSRFCKDEDKEPVNNFNNKCQSPVYTTSDG